MAGEHILIVDDSSTNLKLIRVLLEADGFHASTVADAKSAFEHLAVQLPDLILVDLQMPVMDGLALARLLKADDRLRSVPVVALTAFAMKGDRERAIEAGCDGYLTKPVDTRAFAGILTDFLRRSRNNERTLS